MIYVICTGSENDPDDFWGFGPFEDEAWAHAWIRQHHNDPLHQPPPDNPTEEEYNSWEDIVIKRAEDRDHFCENEYTSAGIHYVVSSFAEPGFDPTTLPVYG